MASLELKTDRDVAQPGQAEMVQRHIQMQRRQVKVFCSLRISLSLVKEL